MFVKAKISCNLMDGTIRLYGIKRNPQVDEIGAIKNVLQPTVDEKWRSFHWTRNSMV